MLRIAQITDLDGVVKEETMNYIETNHSLYGEFYSKNLFVGMPFCFVYNDDSGQIMQSSTIYYWDYVENDKLYIIETRNSIYYIKEVEE
mgnify:CR=1 FL=1